MKTIDFSNLDVGIFYDFDGKIWFFNFIFYYLGLGFNGSNLGSLFMTDCRDHFELGLNFIVIGKSFSELSYDIDKGIYIYK